MPTKQNIFAYIVNYFRSVTPIKPIAFIYQNSLRNATDLPRADEDLNIVIFADNNVQSNNQASKHVELLKQIIFKYLIEQDGSV